MKHSFDHGLRLMLDAMPELFDVSPQPKEVVIKRPRTSSARVLSNRAWADTTSRLVETIDGLGDPTRKSIGSSGR